MKCIHENKGKLTTWLSLKLKKMHKKVREHKNQRKIKENQKYRSDIFIG